MAIVGAAGAAEPPHYLHEPAAAISLRWPFELAGQTVDRVDLVHPSLDGLEFLREDGALSARSILQVTSTLPLRAIGCLRWPDVEAVLAAAMTLLPPDIAAQVDEAQMAPADEVPGESWRQKAVESTADVVEQLDLNPADFSTTL